MEPEYIETEGKKVYRQKCEIWSRIVGYIRPINSANPGKQAEISDRKMFKIGEINVKT